MSFNRETIRLMPSPFRIDGPVVEYEIETWHCCRDWEIVVAMLTWHPASEMWKREYFHVRKCGYCKEYPRPVENG